MSASVPPAPLPVEAIVNRLLEEAWPTCRLSAVSEGDN
jgi:hypothetical protein